MERIVVPSSVEPRPDNPTVAPATLDAKGQVIPPEVKPAEGEGEKLILGKFKTQADLENAYKELETKNSQKPTEKPAVDPTVEARQTLKDKGLEFDKYASEFIKDGDLSDASYKELLDKGLTMTQVRQFIGGQKALADQNTQQVYDHVGGKESMDKLVEFARTEFTPQEAASYNDAAQRGDLAAVKLMLTGLQSRYDAHFGTTPNLIASTGKAGAAGDTYASLQELWSAQADPRYRKDPAYRASIEQKLERSAKRLNLV